MLPVGVPYVADRGPSLGRDALRVLELGGCALQIFGLEGPTFEEISAVRTLIRPIVRISEAATQLQRPLLHPPNINHPEPWRIDAGLGRVVSTVGAVVSVLQMIGLLGRLSVLPLSRPFVQVMLSAAGVGVALAAVQDAVISIRARQEAVLSDGRAAFANNQGNIALGQVWTEDASQLRVASNSRTAGATRHTILALVPLLNLTGVPVFTNRSWTLGWRTTAALIGVGQTVYLRMSG